MTDSKRHSSPALDALRAERCNEWLLLEDWGPKCAGCGANEYRIDGYCSIECRDHHCDYELRDALEDVEDELVKPLVEQFDAMRDKLDSLYAGYSAKCERFSLGTCDRSADDGQLCRICQFFLGIGWESFEVTSGGLRSWRPVSNPARCPRCGGGLDDCRRRGACTTPASREP